jgi:hypothetical protein
MRPRIFPTAQAELAQINEALRRAYTPPKPPTPNLGAIALTIAIPIAPVVALMLAWSKSVDPMGDAKLNNAPPVKVAAPSSTPRYTQLGDQFVADMPDGRPVAATYVGQHNDWKDLPWTGNKVGDARWLWAYKHWFIWVAPLSPANATPTWIDP